ncbi:hypothetical protein LY78DRAFT_14827 [Colletotrichum sublineola]|nr:hypothetical protein LY78DRAFT_14827 [Colletotrichum sublineola]
MYLVTVRRQGERLSPGHSSALWCSGGRSLKQHQLGVPVSGLLEGYYSSWPKSCQPVPGKPWSTPLGSRVPPPTLVLYPSLAHVLPIPDDIPSWFMCWLACLRCSSIERAWSGKEGNWTRQPSCQVFLALLSARNVQSRRAAGSKRLHANGPEKSESLRSRPVIHSLPPDGVDRRGCHWLLS